MKHFTFFNKVRFLLKVYTLEEIAKILNVTTRVVRDYIKSGKLKRIDNIGLIRVTEENLKKFLNGGEQ